MANDGNEAEDSGTEPTLPAVAIVAVKPAAIELARVERTAYAVGAEIARGGLGRVLRAHDQRLDRPVAIKELLKPLEGKKPGPEVRFAREALLTARLQHPSIVPVYEAGVWPDGSPFYAMKLVTGRSLEAVVKDTLTFE